MCDLAHAVAALAAEHLEMATYGASSVWRPRLLAEKVESERL